MEQQSALQSVRFDKPGFAEALPCMDSVYRATAPDGRSAEDGAETYLRAYRSWDTYRRA
jgi:hypothetical protein